MHNAGDAGKGAPGPRTWNSIILFLKVESTEERCKVESKQKGTLSRRISNSYSSLEPFRGLLSCLLIVIVSRGSDLRAFLFSFVFTIDLIPKI